MSFTDTKLSYYHTFSKMPVENDITLGNAINKSGHTVSATEVWASDIPYFGKMGSLADVIAKVQPYASKNDMCFITAGDDANKTFQYDGAGNWVDITEDLKNGFIIKNAKDENVLLYHKGINLTNLDETNNANTDSKDNAARLWVTIDKNGETIPDGKTRLVEQFVGVTDKSLNGLASVAYAPVINNGDAKAGTDYYDYCYSGTILWETARTVATPIDCFEYIGKKVVDALTDIQVSASGGVTNVTTEASNAGFSVTTQQISDGKTQVVLDVDVATVTEGEIADSDGNKLISASNAKAVAEQAVNAALGENGVIDTAIDTAIQDSTLSIEGSTDPIASADGNVELEDKLVTAEQVITYVENNAKVSVSAGEETGSAVTSIDFNGEAGADVSVTVANEVADGAATITVSAALSKATVTNGAIDATEGNGDKVVSATDAKAIADAAVTTLAQGAVATNTAAIATLNGEADVEGSVKKALADAKAYTDAEIIELTGAGEGSLQSQITANTTAIGNLKGVSLEKTSTQTTISNSTTPTITVKTTGTIGTGLTGITVETGDIASATALSALDTKVTNHIADAAKLGIVVAPAATDGTPDVDAPSTNKIYLVLNADDAESGSYIEWIYVVTATDADGNPTEYTWESIGSTKTDLSDYAKTNDVTSAITTAKSEAISAAAEDATTKADAAQTAAEETAAAALTAAQTALEGQISTAKSELEGQISTAKTEAIDDAKTYTDGQIGTPATGEDKDDATGLYAVIESAKNEAISGADVTIIAENGISLTGADANGKVTGKEFTISALDASDAQKGIVQLSANESITANENAESTVIAATTSAVAKTAATLVTKITTAQGAAEAAQTSASKRLTTIFKINPSDERFTIGTAEDNVVDGTKDGMKIGISLAENIATTDIFEIGEDGNPVKDTDGNPVVEEAGTVYTKGQIDKKITDIIGGEISGISGGYIIDINDIVDEHYEGKKITIGNADNYFGSDIVTTDTNNAKITVSAPKSWSVGNTKPADSITSVTNGKASNGSIIDTENLTDGASMFSGNTNLVSVCSDFGNMTSAVSMFSGCTGLTSFCGDLGSLTTGTNMFSGCEELSEFVGDLSSLTTANGMFAGCSSLTSEQVDFIIDVLPTYAQADAASHQITIANAKQAQIDTALAKGWTVTA